MSGARTPAPRGTLWLLALLLPIAFLFFVDVGLRALGWLPPQDPLVFHARSFDAEFSPFVEVAPGVLEIRPDWQDRGKRLRRERGRRAGRFFLYPGFRPVRLAREKAEATLRVFVLGGSTTFGLYVGAEGAFPRLLEARLQSLAGDRRVEVVNLGCPGWDSERVRNLLGSVLELDPDLVVVYAGHNEMLQGEVGVGAQLGRFAKLRAGILARSSLAAWLDRGLSGVLRARDRTFADEEVAALEAGRTPTFILESAPTSERRLPSESFRNESAARYGANVHAMLDLAGAAGVPILFVVPVSNLLSPPRFSGHPPDFGRSDEFRAEVARARDASAGDDEAALAALDRAVALSPGHAGVRYQRALLLLELGRPGRALAELQRATDLDGQTQRITSDLEAALVNAVESAGGAAIDPRPVFREDPPGALPPLFYDHVHPTERGHELIAELLLPAAAAELGLVAAGESDP